MTTGEMISIGGFGVTVGTIIFMAGKFYSQLERLRETDKEQQGKIDDKLYRSEFKEALARVESHVNSELARFERGQNEMKTKVEESSKQVTIIGRDIEYVVKKVDEMIERTQ